MEEYSELSKESDYYSSTTNNLIKQLIALQKHPSIESNLSGILQEYLGQLRESDKYIENGIFVTNFAKAAYLLQNAVDLYGKKVDLLWNCIMEYHKSFIVNQTKVSDKEELEKVEERQHKYRRKKRVINPNAHKDDNCNDFSFGGGYDNYLGQTSEQHDLLREWEKFDKNKIRPTKTSTSEIITNHKLFQPDTAVHNLDDGEYLGRYDQIQSTSLVDELIQLSKSNSIDDEYSCLSSMEIENCVINDFLFENKISSEEPKENYVTSLNKNIEHFLNDRNKRETYNIFKQSPISINDLAYKKANSQSADQLIPKKPRRISFADSLFGNDANVDDLPNSSNLNLNPEPLPTNTDSNESPAKRNNISISNDSAFYDCDNTDLNNDTEEIDDVPLFEAGNVITSTPISPKKTSHISDKSSASRHLCFGGSIIIPTSIKNKTINKIKDGGIDKVKSKVSRKISRSQLEKLAKGVTVVFKEFEEFYCSQYKISDGEDLPRPELNCADSVMDEIVDDDCVVCDFEIEEIADAGAEMNQTNVNDDDNNTTDNIEIVDNSAENNSSCNNNNNNNNNTNNDDGDGDIEQSMDFSQEETVHNSRQNLHEWKTYISTKIRNFDESDFDIHDYGSKIIDSIELGETKFFKDIVKNKSAGEVARIFMASLQLANMGNINIKGVKSGALSNDTFAVELVDKVRHHEQLEDYQAPSEETLKDRLSKVKAMRPSVSGSIQPPAKKFKFSHSNKRKFSY